MYQLFLALILAFGSPAQHTNHNNIGGNHTVVALDGDPTGDNGHNPPPPPPPPGH